MATHTSWQGFEEDAPDLAVRIRGRFAANLHHIIGTVRADGSPRLSGTEVTFRRGEVAIGMMAGSRKHDDVRRDPRVELHSAPLEEDLASGDAKLAGTLVPAEGRPGPPGEHFVLGVRSASLVRVVDDEVVISIWTGPGELREVRRR